MKRKKIIENFLDNLGKIFFNKIINKKTRLKY